MKALILNSGMGSRMGGLTAEIPKCMLEISSNETILSRQLCMLKTAGITDIVITVGYLGDRLIRYCKGINLAIDFTFVNNEDYASTNYIYSIYKAREYLDEDIVAIHGDLVFETSVLDAVINFDKSCMIVSKTAMLSQKDFKAIIRDNHIFAIGINYFDGAVAAQPIYKFNKKDGRMLLKKIIEYCEHGNRNCYAENAFNDISSKCMIYPIDIGNKMCYEIDNSTDLAIVKKRLRQGVM